MRNIGLSSKLRFGDVTLKHRHIYLFKLQFLLKNVRDVSHYQISGFELLFGEIHGVHGKTHGVP